LAATGASASAAGAASESSYFSNLALDMLHLRSDVVLRRHVQSWDSMQQPQQDVVREQIGAYFGRYVVLLSLLQQYHFQYSKS
jgi:hypothetical protein